jgi:hypothetical protein
MHQQLDLLLNLGPASVVTAEIPLTASRPAIIPLDVLR